MASDEEDTIAAEFPPHPDATMIEIEEVKDSDLPFAGSNATAALYVVDDKGMLVAGHYSNTGGYHGWAFSGEEQPNIFCRTYSPRI